MIKIYVGNLPFSMTEEELKEVFTQAGAVAAVKIVKDAYDGKSRGFGFVEMADEAGGTAAMEKLNGFEVKGRGLKLDRAKVQNTDHDGNRARRPANNRNNTHTS